MASISQLPWDLIVISKEDMGVVSLASLAEAVTPVTWTWIRGWNKVFLHVINEKNNKNDHIILKKALPSLANSHIKTFLFHHGRKACTAPLEMRLCKGGGNIKFTLKKRIK